MLVRRSSTKQFGFTLIEVVVAVFIFGVIATIVTTSLNTFLQSRDRIISKQAQLQDLQKTFLFLSRDLRFINNRLGKDEYGDKGKETMKVNDDGLLSFTTSYPDQAIDGLSVPRRVRWELEDGMLVRYQFPVMDPDNSTRLFKQVMLKGVESAEVEVGSIEDKRASKSNNWDEETRIPNMIAIEIVTDNDLEFRRMFTLPATDQETAQKQANQNQSALQGGSSNTQGAQGGSQSN